MEKSISLWPRPYAATGAYYAEEIRRSLVARYGEAAVLEGGMRVAIAMMPKLQTLADDAVRAGLETLDRRMGYRGALGTLPAPRFDVLKALIAKRIHESGKRHRDEVLVADLSGVLRSENRSPEEDGADEKPSAGEATAEAEQGPTSDEVLRQTGGAHKRVKRRPRL